MIKFPVKFQWNFNTYIPSTKGMHINYIELTTIFKNDNYYKNIYWNGVTQF